MPARAEQDDGTCQGEAVVRITDIEAGVADYPPGSHYGPRRLRDWELVWVIAGSAEWSRTKQVLALRPYDLLLLPPGSPDRFDWHREQLTRHGWIHFTVRDPPRRLRPFQPALLRPMTDQDPLRELCRYAVRLSGISSEDEGATTGRGSDVPGTATVADPPGSVATQLAGTLSLLVDLVLLPAPRAGAQQKASPLLRVAAGAVARRYRHAGPCRIGLDELASAAGVSRRHLSRLLASELGIGPAHALEAVRLARVAALLARSDLTVAAIADVCGYQSPFHLSRRFRAVYGVPPTAYRELSQQWRVLPDPFRGSRVATFLALVASAELAGDQVLREMQD
jgi:AraC family transcriptional regulator